MEEVNVYEQAFNLKYNLVYYITALIVLFLILEFYIRGKESTRVQNFILSICVVVIVILFGLRGLEVGVDTVNNVKYFIDNNLIKSLSEVKDTGLYLFSTIISFFSKDTDVFLISLATLYMMPIYVGIKNLDLKNPLFFFFFLFSFFFFKSMGINTQRQGIAFSLFFCALTYFILNKKKTVYFLFVVAFLFHASIILPIFTFLLSRRIKKINLVLIIYFTATILSFINFRIYDILVEIPIVNILVAERLDSYVNIDSGNYRTGFRPDFWMFNTIFLIIGYITKKNLHKFNVNKGFYTIVFVSYTLLSAFFFLMFSVSFSDRFGFLSWLFIPLLLLPYVENREKVKGMNTITVFLICVFLATIFKII